VFADALDRCSSPDPVWAEFVAQHPELTAVPAFTDADVLQTLEQAIASRESWRAAYACDIARRIFGDEFNCLRERPAVEAVAQRLLRHTAAGKVVRLRPSYGSTC
jgi:hypothetical protein